jgi:hypothetical protein
MKVSRSLLLLALIGFPTGSAEAREIFGGLLAHDVKTPVTRAGYEGGADLQLGWRGDGIRALSLLGSPSPHLFGSISTTARLISQQPGSVGRLAARCM